MGMEVLPRVQGWIYRSKRQNRGKYGETVSTSRKNVEYNGFGCIHSHEHMFSSSMLLLLLRSVQCSSLRCLFNLTACGALHSFRMMSMMAEIAFMADSSDDQAFTLRNDFSLWG